MPIELANAVATTIEVYLLVGLVFALWFSLRGAARLDPVARSGTPGFRLLVIPGAILMWPWLALQLAGKRGGAPVTRGQRRMHLVAWLLLMPLAIIVLVVATSERGSHATGQHAPLQERNR